MHNILIVEDDKLQRDELSRTIQKNYPNWNIICVSNFTDAKLAVEKSIEYNNIFTLFLLDVQLKNDPHDLSGFTLAGDLRTLKPYFTTPILFLTAISEKTQFALSNYHCYNYITKPYSSSDILYQIQQMMLTGFLDENSITIIDTNRIKHRIALKNIYYIETKSHLLVLSTVQGEISTREFTFSTILSKLNHDFVQCHRKYIININYINNYDKTNRFIHINQKSISVSRTYKSTLENLLNKCFF